MKRITIVLAALLMVFCLAGCDAIVDLMGGMGNNAAGKNQQVIDTAVEAAKPQSATAETTENEDGSTTKTLETGALKLTTNTKDEVSTSTISLGEGLEFEIPAEVAKDLADIDAIITYSDQKELITTLSSGGENAKAVKEEMKKPADEDSKKAFEGTQTIISVVLDNVMGESTELPAEVKSVLETITEKSGEEITQGDVVVLTAVTNILLDDAVLSNIGTIAQEIPAEATEEEKAALEEQKAAAEEAITSALMDNAMDLLAVMTVVPSDIATGLTGILNSFGK